METLEHAVNQFNGVMIKADALPSDPAEFRARLEHSLALWQEARHAVVWLEVPLARARLIPEAVEAGFGFHHSAETHLVMTRSAQVTLGGIFGEGRGVPQDYVEAIKWYRLAAEHGDAGAQLRLGSMYANGQGVPQDYAEAARWYSEAAEQGNALAQVNLGGMYAHGQGVKADKVLAHMWYNLASAAGQSDASKYRNTVAESMKPEEIAEAQRLAREWTPRRSSLVQGP